MAGARNEVRVSDELEDSDVDEGSDIEIDQDIEIDLSAFSTAQDAERTQAELDISEQLRDDDPTDSEMPVGARREPGADGDYALPEYHTRGTVLEDANPAGWPDEFAGENGVYKLPSGVEYIDGEGSVRTHEDGTVFNYGKDVDTGSEGRQGATHDDMTPDSRRSRLDMDLLKDPKIGFNAKEHLQDPLFFLLLILPVCDAGRSERRGGQRAGVC